jgi:hypothetical protein
MKLKAYSGLPSKKDRAALIFFNFPSPELPEECNRNAERIADIALSLSLSLTHTHSLRVSSSGK